MYDALDEILAMIRKSEGKADAKNKLVDRFGLDEDQAEAIPELKLYRFGNGWRSSLIREELGQRQKIQRI